LTDLLFEKHYNKFIEEGYSEKKAKRMAEKTSIEDARLEWSVSEPMEDLQGNA
jgi:hypothetical protein